jgi:hypothetical protein
MMVDHGTGIAKQQIYPRTGIATAFGPCNCICMPGGWLEMNGSPHLCDLAALLDPLGTQTLC